MKRRLAIILVGLAFPCLVLAQTPPKKAAAKAGSVASPSRVEVEKQIIAHERATLAAFYKSDITTFTSHVTPEAFGLDATAGVVTVADWQEMMKDVNSARIENWDIDHAQVHWVTPDTAILTYHWSGTMTGRGQSAPEGVWVASVYVKRGERWLPMFNMQSGPEQKRPTTTK